MSGQEQALEEANRKMAGDAGAAGTRPFLVAVLAASLLAGIAGGLSQLPTAGAPGYALDSGLVYRLEIGLVVFVALYSVIVVIRLASQGLTPSRVGTTAVDLPQLVETVGDLRSSLSKGGTATDDVFTALENQANRLGSIECMLGGGSSGDIQERS